MIDANSTRDVNISALFHCVVFSLGHLWHVICAIIKASSSR